jgi:hypothetical protein
LLGDLCRSTLDLGDHDGLGRYRLRVLDHGSGVMSKPFVLLIEG